MTREVCLHNVRTEDKCPDCEAEGSAFRVDVRNGKVPCPICGGEPFRGKYYNLFIELQRLQVREEAFNFLRKTAPLAPRRG